MAYIETTTKNWRCDKCMKLQDADDFKTLPDYWTKVLCKSHSEWHEIPELTFSKTFCSQCSDELREFFVNYLKVSK